MHGLKNRLEQSAPLQAQASYQMAARTPSTALGFTFICNTIRPRLHKATNSEWVSLKVKFNVPTILQPIKCGMNQTPIDSLAPRYFLAGNHIVRVDALLDQEGTLPACWVTTRVSKAAQTRPIQLSKTIRLEHPPFDRKSKQCKTSRQVPLSQLYLQIHVYMNKTMHI